MTPAWFPGELDSEMRGMEMVLIIRREQVEMFDTAAAVAFNAQIVSYLRSNHPETEVRLTTGTCFVQNIPEKQFQGLVNCGINRARKHNLEFASNQIAFVVLMFLVAPNFDKHPVIDSFFIEHSGIADYRFHRVWEDVSDSDWQIAKSIYDVEAWR